jgi:putative FmdB family regulatory protein
MPLYQYKCTICNHDFEVFQHMNDPVLHTCPKCNHRALERIIGAPAIRTTADFTRGKGTLLTQCGGDEAEVKRIVTEAKKQGYTPRDTDIYEPGLAKRCGDPAAFIPSSDPIGGMKRACKELGTGCEGRGVKIQAPPQRDPPRKRAVAGAS